MMLSEDTDGYVLVSFQSGGYFILTEIEQNSIFDLQRIFKKKSANPDIQKLIFSISY